MRKTLTYGTLSLAVAAGLVAAVASPAAATVTAPECRTATTNLADRPDSGLHGDWAKDTFVRTVKICESAPPAVESATLTARSTYTAEVTDAGTFVTVAGKSPNAGVDLAAGIKGYLAGGFSASFTAVSHFKNYQAKFDKKSYTGEAPSSTGDWVKNLWGHEDFQSVTNLVAWKWTHWTCSKDVAKATEKWVNADPDVNEGDITGTACPSPSPSPSASTTPTATASPSTGGTAGGLPVTGSNTGILAGGAIALIAVGAGLFLIGYRRRRFTA